MSMKWRVLLWMTGGSCEPDQYLAALDQEPPVSGPPRACSACPMRRGGEWADGAIRAIGKMSPDQRARFAAGWGCHASARPCAGAARIAREVAEEYSKVGPVPADMSFSDVLNRFHDGIATGDDVRDLVTGAEALGVAAEHVVVKRRRRPQPGKAVRLLGRSGPLSLLDRPVIRVDSTHCSAWWLVSDLRLWLQSPASASDTVRLQVELDRLRAGIKRVAELTGVGRDANEDLISWAERGVQQLRKTVALDEGPAVGGVWKAARALEDAITAAGATCSDVRADLDSAHLVVSRGETSASVDIFWDEGSVRARISTEDEHIEVGDPHIELASRVLGLIGCKAS